MTERITTDELYQLRGLLAKLRAEPGFRDQVYGWVDGTLTMTSVVLDTRRERVASADEQVSVSL